MPKRTFKAEDILNKLREAEVLTSQGKTLEEVCRALSISDQTDYRWPPLAKHTAGWEPSRPNASRSWRERTLNCAKWLLI